MENNKNSKNSLMMLISAMLIFGTIGIFRRCIDLSSGLLAFLRGVIGAAFLLAVMLIRGGRAEKRPGEKRTAGIDKNGGSGSLSEAEAAAENISIQERSVSGIKLALLILSGGLIGINWMLLFEAYNHTTVAIATLCYYMQPTIVILLSAVIFRERLNVKKICCALAAIVGMVLVSGVIGGSSLPEGNSRGVMLGLGAALFYSSVVLLNKKIGSMNVYIKTVIQLISASMILVPYLVLTEDISAVSMDGIEIIMILIVGLLHTGIAYALYFGSMAGLRAQTIAIFSYIDPVTALILSALILGEPFTAGGAIGAVLIIGAAIISEL
mgnify:FL=1